MKFVFRTDASLQIGSGHVTRCLTLAKALYARGAKCKFICREHEGHLIEKIRHESFECNALAKSTEMYELDDAYGPTLAHAGWLGASWQSDAQETIQALGEERVDWLVVDHYALDERWEQAVRPHAKKILVIDDLADRYHDCELLLDQNLIANFETRYQHLMPEYSTTLLGPEYALLQPEYAEFHRCAPTRKGPIRRALIYFGGADHDNLAGRALTACLSLGRKDLSLDVVISPNSPHTDSIQALAHGRRHVALHSQLPSLAPLILRADIAIGACGATSWERCCLGLPTLVITLAENQKPVAGELERRELIRWLGHLNHVSVRALLAQLESIFDKDRRSSRTEGLDLTAMSAGGIRLVDGRGVGRVISQVMEMV